MRGHHGHQGLCLRFVQQVRVKRMGSPPHAPNGGNNL